MQTVAELIEELKKLPQDAIPVTGDDYRNPYYAEVRRVSLETVCEHRGGYDNCSAVQNENPDARVVHVVYIR